jgi:hypothetical protein
MNRINFDKPFGLIFEESPEFQPLQIDSKYDEDWDMNVVLDENGIKIPCVEYGLTLGTKTETRVSGEVSDDDDQMSYLGTKTRTFENQEDSDSDEGNLSSFLGTKTSTAIEKEKPDTDDYYSSFCCGTKTSTKTYGEDCDADEENEDYIK